MTVTQTVADQLEAIRQPGEIDMLDRRMVERIAYRHEFYELIAWIQEIGRGYGEAIMHGITVEEDAGTA